MRLLTQLFFYFLLGTIGCTKVFAGQENNKKDSTVFRIIDHNFYEDASYAARYYVDSAAALTAKEVKDRIFNSPGGGMPLRNYNLNYHTVIFSNRKVWICLNVENTLDTSAALEFYFGVAANTVVTFFEGDSIIATKYCGWNTNVKELEKRGQRHVVLLKVKPHQKFTMLASLQDERADLYYIYSFIGTPQFDTTVKNTNHFLNSSDYISLVVLGMILSICIFMLLSFFQIRSVDYLYYAIYLLLTAIYFFHMLLSISFINFTMLEFEYFLGVEVQLFSLLFYFLFAKAFLDLKFVGGRLNRLAKAIIVLLCIYIIACIIIYNYFSMSFFFTLTAIMRLSIILASAFAIILLLRIKNMLVKYFMSGTLFLIGGFTALFIYSRLASIGVVKPGYLFNIHPGHILSLGIVGEMICFALGLSYKQKLVAQQKIIAEETLKYERETAEIKKMQAVIASQEAERMRVSRELHDDLGSELSTIRFLSEAAMNKKEIEGNNTVLEKISVHTNNLIESMRQIVWTMDPESNSLPELIFYIKNYANEYLTSANIECSFEIPEEIPERKLTGDARRNIFLVVKEALHNISKHSGANHVLIKINLNEKTEINIHDNGKGASTSLSEATKKAGSGHGLKNMKRRMEQVNGSFEIINDEGTTVKISF